MSKLINSCLVAFIAVIFSFFTPVNTIKFKLSQIFFDENYEEFQLPVFPRRNLEEELGEHDYNCLVSSALSTNGGICLAERNGDDQAYLPPSISPVKNPEYGVDVSFPMHHRDHHYDEAKKNGLTETYSSYINGCKTYYKNEAAKCERSEDDRLDMCRNQPPSMQNYTLLGFQKTKVPEHLMQDLTRFWDYNHVHASKEKWHPGDIHTNHWDVPTFMLSLDNPHLKQGGPILRNKIWESTRKQLQNWIDDEADAMGLSHFDLSPASLYGIRVYNRGSILAPHVDRLPLVTSAIINVAQSVEEPWPLEVIGHDGKAYNITLEPGEMILYESHSIIHGRPFPLKGDLYANIFVHFEPTGHCLRHADRMNGKEVDGDAEQLYKREQRKLSDNIKMDQQNILPFYIHDHTEDSNRWKQMDRYEKNKKDLSIAPPIPHINQAAAMGHLSVLKSYLIENKNDPSSLDKADINGWRPIHEAARAGKTEVMKWLIDQGVDINARTNDGRGASPLWWAEETLGPKHETTKLLIKSGAKKIAPEFKDY